SWRSVAQPARPDRQRWLRVVSARLLALAPRDGAARMMPRVAVVTPYFHPIIGGVESNAERFARFLRSRSADVCVVTKRITRLLPDRDLHEGVPVQRVGQ